MALTIHHQKDPDMAKVTVDRRLWLAADGVTLVEDGDPDAAFLWATDGREVLADEAERVGYRPSPDATSTADQEHAAAPDEVEVPAGKVACPEDGCDYVGTERGLKIHTGQVHDDEG